MVSSQEAGGDPLFDVRGKIILVTGASSGIGLHLCGTLAGRGARVIAASRTASKNAALAELARTAGLSVAVTDIDVSSPESVARGVAEAGGLHGRFDAVINNAGIVTPQRVAESSVSALRSTFETNLMGPFLVTRSAIEFMPPGSSLIQIASICAFRAVVGLSAYAASKAGIVMMTQTLALELADRGIRANAIVPGYVLTSMNKEFLESPRGQAILDRIPAGRFATPHDLDGAALFLCSEASAYVNGGCIAVDGGFLV